MSDFQRDFFISAAMGGQAKPVVVFSVRHLDIIGSLFPMPLLYLFCRHGRSIPWIDTPQGDRKGRPYLLPVGRTLTGFRPNCLRSKQSSVFAFSQLFAKIVYEVNNHLFVRFPLGNALRKQYTFTRLFSQTLHRKTL